MSEKGNGSDARKKQLEAELQKLERDIDETTDQVAKLRLLVKYKKLEDEYNLYYND